MIFLSQYTQKALLMQACPFVAVLMPCLLRRKTRESARQLHGG